MSRTALVVVLLAVIGSAIGWQAATVGLFVDRAVTEPMPEPYVVPRQPGGLSLSLAMVHDVLHERYVRHGREYYAARIERLATTLPTAGDESPDQLAATLNTLNDLAVAQFQIGQATEALVTLDRKQALQNDLDQQWQRERMDASRVGIDALWVAGDAERLELYRTYANRGTILILDALREGLHENPVAQEKLKQGTEIIREAIAMNADSHFGREPWQLVILEFLQAVCERPELLLEFDMVGNRLDADPAEVALSHVAGWPERCRELLHDDALLLRMRKGQPDEATRKLRTELREKWITRVGAEQGWTDVVPTIHQYPVPFDEPTLAIVGMWMIGGGPNPHFAVALGGIMERVGEPELAWKAYRRAELLADGIWPDPVIEQGFSDRCRSHRVRLERLLEMRTGSATELDVAARLERQFLAELRIGQAYQQAYQAFEHERITSGSDPDDTDFDTPFFERQGRIASPAADFDQVPGNQSLTLSQRLPAMVFGAGLFALPAAVLLKRRSRVRPAPAAS